jgi:hypothetical protein
LTETFQKEATEGKLRAAGICYDVLTVPPGKHQKQDAGLEHCLGETVDVFKPCVWTEGGNFQYGEIFAAKRTPQFLSEILLMAADSLAIGYIAVRSFSSTCRFPQPDPVGSVVTGATEAIYRYTRWARCRARNCAMKDHPLPVLKINGNLRFKRADVESC